jgi:hypothetical protein
VGVSEEKRLSLSRVVSVKTGRKQETSRNFNVRS